MQSIGTEEYQSEAARNPNTTPNVEANDDNERHNDSAKTYRNSISSYTERGTSTSLRKSANLQTKLDTRKARHKHTP